MNEQQIGVGPHAKPWPLEPKYDLDLLENGDKRNVIDKYRYWTVEAIKADLDNSRASLHVAVENWQHDLNIGTIVRAANAFNVETVHIIGRHHWNKRGAMVTDRYMNIEYHTSVEEFADKMKAENRQIIAVDSARCDTDVKIHISQKGSIGFGGEGPGLSEQMQKAAFSNVMIEQFGSTRSVNVGVAAGIAMYVWVQQHIFKQ